jgi:protein O-mannosyl-transferase
MRQAATETQPDPTKAVTSVAAQPRSAPWLIATLLVLATIALYWPVTGYDFINVDDPDYVAANPHVLGGLTWENICWAFTSQGIGLWHPLTWISHMLDCECFGLRPGLHHLTSLLIHAANTALLFVVLRTMTGALWRSAAVAALFALHPLHVESVAWVAERKDVLSTTFALLTLLAYHRYSKSLRRNVEARMEEPVASGTQPGADDTLHVSRFPRVPLLFYLLSLFLFACGLMSKPMIVTLPLVLLLLDYWPLGRFRASTTTPQTTSILRLFMEKLPFVVLAVLTSLITLQSGTRFGALPSVAEVPIPARLANATLSYSGYLVQAFWPIKLVVYYPFPSTLSFWCAGGAGALLIGISVTAFCLARRWPFVVVGWLWYLATLLPVIGLIQLANYSHADRYTYVPLIGVFVALIWSVGEVLSPWRGRDLGYLAVTAGAVMLLCLMCARRQVGYWRESVTLLRHALEVTEDNWFAHNKLGTAFYQHGRMGEAIRQFQEAIRLNPKHADAHDNLGAAFGKNGQTDEAIVQFQEALRLEPNHPLAHYNLGNALLLKGQTDEAIRQFQAAVRLKPDHAEARYNLGTALGSKGQTAEAITQYQEAIRLNPGNADAHYNLGLALASKGQADEAIRRFEATLKVKPEYPEAHLHLGLVLVRKGQTDEAIQQFQEALRLKPDYAAARQYLDAVFAARAHSSTPTGAATNR